MTTYIGIDWAGGSWVVVTAGEETTVTTEPSILNVWHEHGEARDAQAILIDVPIGLHESGPRACDVEAQEYLGNRGNTVFTIPAREVVEADDYPTARSLNGGSLSSQSWWLFPRIREIDVFLREHDAATEKLYESHPEICFQALHGRPLERKTTESGLDERLEILHRYDSEGHLADRVEEVVSARRDGTAWHDRLSSGRIDDVVDAAVLALTAKRLDIGPRSDSRSYPAFPERETPGRDPAIDIRPEIVYPQGEHAKED